MHNLKAAIAKCFKRKHYFAIHRRGIKDSNLTPHRAVPLCLAALVRWLRPFAGRQTGPSVGHKAPQIKERENSEERDYLLQVTFHKEGGGGVGGSGKQSWKKEKTTLKG